MKIYVIGPSTEYASWLKGDLVDSAEKADILLFTGGSDVDPRFYNEPEGKHTYSNLPRDKAEKAYFDKYFNKFKLGICRGAQFLTVMSGGKLIQHINNHEGNQDVFFSDGTVHTIPSTHHQMMYPFEIEHELLGWADFQSSFYLNGYNKNITLPDNFKEPEVVWYKNSRSFCIQGHPEYPCSDRTRSYLYNTIIDKYNESKVR